MVKKIYELQFGVDMAASAQVSQDFTTALPDAGVMFADNEDTITLTIQLSSQDFDIAPSSLELTLPRTGPSPERASCAIIPKHEGRSALTAIVQKAGNFLFEMQIEYSVGLVNATPATSVTTGRPLAAAVTMTPRELGLSVSPVANGYACTVWGAITTSVVLPLSEAELGDAISAVRSAMMDVVTFADASGTRPFQQGIDIDAASNATALKGMAFAGRALFDSLFFGPQAGPDVQAVGTWIRNRATKAGELLKLQVLADRFPVPWGLLYLGDVANNAPLSWDNFLGMRHIIEQIPRQTNLQVDDAVITSNAPSLSVSVTVTVS